MFVHDHYESLEPFDRVGRLVRGMGKMAVAVGCFVASMGVAALAPETGPFVPITAGASIALFGASLIAFASGAKDLVDVATGRLSVDIDGNASLA